MASKRCGVIALDLILNHRMGKVTNRKEAISRLSELNEKNMVIPFTHPSIGKRKLLLYAPRIEKKALLYETKYSWSKYLCPNTIALDIGLSWGDSTVLIGSALENGIVLGFDINHASYLANEWTSRLNPDLNIIPFHMGVKSDGIASWDNIGKRRARIVPLMSWMLSWSGTAKNLIKHISFVKIDTDGNDAEISKSLLPLIQAGNKPVIMIEWFLNYRASSNLKACSKNSLKIWETAKALNYDVWDIHLTSKFDSCEDAVKYFHDYDRDKKSKSFQNCGGADQLDFCDVIMMPSGVTKENRAEYCPPTIKEDDITSTKEYFNFHV